MTTEADRSRAHLQRRVERALSNGFQCADCFVQVLRGEGMEVPNHVAAITPALERGVAGTGEMCGVLLAALLTRALQDEGPSGDEQRKSPINEWLDTFRPTSFGAGRTRSCVSLGTRLTTFAKERYGGTECHQVSGMDVSAGVDGASRMYYVTDGASRCSGFITEAVQALLDSRDEEHQQ